MLHPFILPGSIVTDNLGDKRNFVYLSYCEGLLNISLQVGMKGNPKINRGLDGDVIVAEVRATSHKPDEIYGIIERLSPGTRKLELFGRPHNVQPNW